MRRLDKLALDKLSSTPLRPLNIVTLKQSEMETNDVYFKT